jgi:hypothetical protein
MDSSATRWAARAVSALLVVVLVLLGVWVTGGLLTDDATTAKVLTACWFGASGLGALLVARTWPRLAVTTLAAWFITSAVAGGFLLVTSEVDRVVHEDVVVAVPPTTADGGTHRPSSTAAAGARLEATGRFRSGEHETRGRVEVVRTPDGVRLLTLTRFATAPGPDLRVYLVPGRTGVRDAVDLGRLKGNKGDQQYVVPSSARGASVVVWCRAFSVAFGTAVLRDA